MTSRGVFIAGHWHSGDGTRHHVSPWTGDVVAQYATGDADAARAAVDAAAAASADDFPVRERSQVLEAVAAAVSDHADTLATSICRDSGKPITAARTEVSRAVTTLRYAAEECRRLPGERVPLETEAATANALAVTVPHPRGIVAAITPFNFPLNLVAHKVGPALAAGCPVVLKPSDKAPGAALTLTQLFTDAGLPPGWLNVVNGPAETIVGTWLDDERVEVINFTGSAAVGWDLKARSPKKLHILELGSNSAMYVDHTADLTRAAHDAVTAGFANSGQACISLQRLYADAAIADKLTTLICQAAAQVAYGDPADPATTVGPLITDAAANRVSQWVETAQRRGATIAHGGTRHGQLLQPTVVTGAGPDDPLIRDEVFGPVLSLATVTGPDEAVERINDSRYGLNTSIYTAQLATAMSFTRQVRAGTVLVNVPPSFRADHMPYGGVKDSGQGREGVRHAIAELVEMKLLVFTT